MKTMSNIEKKFVRDLRKVVKVCFEMAEDYSLVALAEKADLCTATLERLWNEETVYPRLMTVQKLCGAVGLQVTWCPEQKKTTLKLVA